MKGKTGNTRDCLVDFFRRHGRSTELAKFAKVDRGAERCWRLRGRLPFGETLLRVRYFLDLVGYDVEELKNIHPALLIVGQCIALDLISLRDVTAEIALKKYHNLFEYFRGDSTPSSERLARLKTIAARLEVERKSALIAASASF